MDLRARIRRAFGADLEAALAPVEARDGDVILRGFVAPPRLARADTARQMWFLNGRAVRDKVLVRALKEGYRGFLFESRQPVAFLHLSMDPAKVDVNVHPAKSEVRFRDERRLFGFLVNAIRGAVRATDMATPGERLVETALRREARAAEAPWSAPSSAIGSSTGSASAFFSGIPSRAREPYEVREVPPAPGAANRGPEPEAPHDSPDVHGPLLQIDRTYIVRPLGDGFEIVDQHALHERIQFEALADEMRRGAVETQRLLVPELVELSRAEVLMLAEHFDALTRIGIELSAFGETTVAVNGLPARLARPRAEGIVRDALAVIEDQRELTADRMLEEVLHRAACRSSVMAGDALSDEEMRALLERGRHLLSDQTCVHGRPTRVRFAAADLEKAFNRR
jgi:DNA mismatch repair protein MutL